MKKEFIRKNNFLGFAFISGAGWILDIVIFSLLLKNSLLDISFSNKVSSFIALTFVWFVSTRRIFNVKGRILSRFLLFYWFYQCCSIYFYSNIISYFSLIIQKFQFNEIILLTPPILSKLILTPFNLITNFYFSKFLTSKIKG